MIATCSLPRFVSSTVLLPCMALLAVHSFAQEDPPERIQYAQFPRESATALSFSTDGRYLRVQGGPYMEGVYDMRSRKQVHEVDPASMTWSTRTAQGIRMAPGYSAHERFETVMNAKGTKEVDKQCFIDVVDERTQRAIWSALVGHREKESVYMKLICFVPERQVFICCVTQRDDRKDYPFNHANTFLEVNYLDKSVKPLSTSVGSVDDVYTRNATGRYAAFHNQGYCLLDTRTGALQKMKPTNTRSYPDIRVCRDSLLVFIWEDQPGTNDENGRSVSLEALDIATGQTVRSWSLNINGPFAFSTATGQLAYTTCGRYTCDYAYLKSYDLLTGEEQGMITSDVLDKEYAVACRQYAQVQAAKELSSDRKAGFLRQVRQFQQAANKLGWRVSSERRIASWERNGEMDMYYDVPCTLSRDSTYAAVFVSMIPDVQLWGRLKFNDDALPGQPWAPDPTPLKSTAFTANAWGYLQQRQGDKHLLFDDLCGYLFGASTPDSTTHWMLLAHAAAASPALPTFGDIDLSGLPTYDLDDRFTTLERQAAEYRRAQEAEEAAARERERQREAEITRRNTALMHLQEQIDNAVPATWSLCNACGGTGRVFANRSTCHCCGGNGGYSEAVPTFHKTGDRRIERPNYSSPTHPTIDVYYEPIGYTTYESVRHACDCCGGTGSEGSGETTGCPACGGKGRVPR